MPIPAPRMVPCLVAAALAFAAIVPARGQAARPQPGGAVQVLRDGFESARVAWLPETTEATVRIYAQERTKRAAHEGAQSEGFSFVTGVGGGFYYSYALPKIPVTDDLKVSMYIRSNRAGMYLTARVVLPADVDPEKGQPSAVQVQSSSYEESDRWQRVTIAEMLPEVERQARVIRATTRRKVSLEGAYVERLVVNLYGGEGPTEVYLDELQLGPVPAEVAEAWSPGGAARPARPRAVAVNDRAEPADNAPLPPLPTSSRIKFEGSRLTRDGFPLFFTGVRGLGMNPVELRRAGFDLLFLPPNAEEETAINAARAGLMLVPELVGPVGAGGVSLDADQIVSAAATHPAGNAVAFWSIGQDLGRELDLEPRLATLRRTREAVRGIRRAQPGGVGLATATVRGMVPEYARLPENLDMVGIALDNWATVQDPLETLSYLRQRQFLTARSNPNALLWARIDASAPPIYRESVWGRDRPPGWGMPRVQPEQIRLTAFAALAAGYRGLCFNADSSLTQGDGRANLIEMMLLNLEIDLLQSILADPDKTVQMLDTYPPNPPPLLPPPVIGMNTSTMRVATPKETEPHGTIKAASIETKDRRGRLLLIADYAPYSQYQPPMSAINKLNVVVPVSRDAVAYEITPGGITVLDADKEVPGGVRVTLRDFGVSAIVLVTTNRDLVLQIQASIERNRHHAVAHAIEQADLMRGWVEEIDAEIAATPGGHTERDSAGLIAQSREYNRSAREKYEALDYLGAWEECRRAGRPLRHLMRFHFLSVYDRIIKSLNDEDLPCGPIPLAGKDKPQERIVQPIVAAPLASWSTLPKAWLWSDWIRGGMLGSNRLPGGDFEFPDGELLAGQGWTDESYELDDVERTIQVQKGGADKRGHHLYLKTRPRAGVALDTLVPFLDHPAVAVRSPAVKVRQQELYRISLKVDLSYPTNPGAGGLIVRDSFGGERLQFRITSAAQSYYEIVFYRRIPVDGELSLLIGLAGYGQVSVDDIQIQPIEQIVDPASYSSGRPRRVPARTSAIHPTSTTPGDPTQPAPAPAPAPARSAARNQPYPIRQ